MPLSEHEQRVLEQIERALYADDPKFAATVRGIDPRTLHRRRYLRAIVGGVIGVVLLPVGIAVQQLELSVAGFVLMLLAFLYGVATWRQTREPRDAVVAPGRRFGQPRRGQAGRGRRRPARCQSAARSPAGQRRSVASCSVSKSAGIAGETCSAAATDSADRDN